MSFQDIPIVVGNTYRIDWQDCCIGGSVTGVVSSVPLHNPDDGLLEIVFEGGTKFAIDGSFDIVEVP